MVKSLKFTRHAKNRMRRHGINESEVEPAIQKPEFLEPSIEGKMNAWVETSPKYLRVTFREEESYFSIITAVKKEKKWGDGIE
ncbi:MAG: DUF4258 domain-containing protein, partial [Deltaproteobacteria bacterium]|nr:DUF4258 domain-containing protein [Deltaproteobacteria bacterium]